MKGDEYAPVVPAAKLPTSADALLDPGTASPADLYFDEQNPRLKGRHGEASSQDEIMAILWREFAVDEVALSVAANGYFAYEPLFVAEEAIPSLGKTGLVVVEGNRRLAAVRLLLDAALRRELKATDLPAASVSVKKSLQELPVILCKREEIWRFVGFKHVNGPQQWDALAKAEYIAWVHNTLDEPLASIASQIGDTHLTAQRMYHALMALEQGEEAGVFNREDRYNKKFFFSHLYTALGYSGIQKYLGMASAKGQQPKPNPIPKNKLEDFGRVCRWIFGDKATDTPPVVKRQNPDLRLLDESIQRPQALAALERGLPLTVTIDIAKGDDRILRESLIAAKTSLQAAKARVVTGYKGEADVLDTAEDVMLVANSIYEEMVAKGTGRTRSSTRSR